VLVGPDGRATNPFRVNQKLTNGEGHTELQITGFNHPASSSNMARYRCGMQPASDHMDDYADNIVLTGKEGRHASQIGSTLFVPEGYKAYVLKSSGRKRPARYYADSMDGNSELGIGPLNGLMFSLMKTGSDDRGVRVLQLLTDGVRFTPVVGGMQGPSLSKVAAIKYLIEGQGLGQEDAELVVKEAQPRQRTTYWIKYAYGEPPTTATFNEPRFGDEYGIKAPIIYPQTEIQNLSQNDNLGAQELYRNDRYLDYDAKQYATMAANLGQKEVLDTAIISGLAKTMDIDEKVDSYLSDLLLGLDRIGRILFHFYWAHDRFRERYGSQDMITLEDNLRNVFKSLGGLTLFLKTKTVEPGGSTSPETRLNEVVGS
jgi:hypothetical protein